MHRQGGAVRLGGIIAKIKAILRRHYSKWAVDLTVEHINSGGDASEVRVPSDVKTCKKNLVRWLAAAFTEMNESFQSTVVHAWDETELSRAWEKQVQTEALVKASSLFPNLATVNGGGGSQMATVVSIGARPVPAEDPTNELDPDAEYEGAPFVEATGEDGEGVPDWVEDGEERGSEL